MPDADYRSMLRAELVQRCKRNRNYSTRALARDLEISPSFLSQLINGHRRLNERRAQDFATKLSWCNRKRKLFSVLVRLENAKDEIGRAALATELNQITQEEDDFFNIEAEFDRVISEWHHLAIMELTELEGFISDHRWISRKLGITKIEVDEAVERLVSIGFIKRLDDGALKKSHPHFTTPLLPSAAVRRFHHQLLGLARKALANQDYESREFCSVTVAVDPAKLPVAREKIESFRRELMTYLECGKRKELYHLSVQLFRIDKDIEKGNSNGVET